MALSEKGKAEKKLPQGWEFYGYGSKKLSKLVDENYENGETRDLLLWGSGDYSWDDTIAWSGTAPNAYYAVKVGSKLHKAIHGANTRPKKTPQNKGKFRALKFDVSANTELNKAVQKKLFYLGYKWHGSGRKVVYANEPYIYTDRNGYILRSLSEQDFEESTDEQINLNEFFALEPKKQMTLAQIEEALGYPVEIVEG